MKTNQCLDKRTMIVVTSKLIDYTTNQPIVGAHVYFKANTNNGIVSDDLGQFALNPTSENDVIVVSHVNYGTQEFRLDQVSPTIYLDPLTNQLDPVILTNKPKINYLKWFGYGFAVIAIAKIIKDSTKVKTGKLSKPNVINIKV